MPTLYLSAPKARTQDGAFYRNFAKILHDRVGPDYAIGENLAAQIHAGTRVVIFDRNDHRQAEGTVSHLKPKPSNRIKRYDVYIPDLHEVSYTQPPSVRRTGVLFV
jgi:hypothetical protein